MKKTNTIIFTLLLLISTFAFALAEDEVAEEIPQVGVFARLRLAFTFNQEKKIGRSLEIAEARLARAEELAEENPEEAARLQEQYDKFSEKAEGVLEKMQARGESEDDLAKMARIQNRFERHQARADEVYMRALERFEANNASEEKIARFEEFYERASNRTAEMEARAIEKRETIMKRRQELSNMTDEELEEMLTNIEEREGIAQERQIRLEKAEKLQIKLNNSNIPDRAKAIIQKRVQTQIQEKVMEQFRKRLNNSNMTEEELRTQMNSSRPMVTPEQVAIARDAIEAELAARAA